MLHTHAVTDTQNNHDERGEERWHESLHSKVMEWGETCSLLAKQHNDAGYGARLKHIVFGLPAPVTTIVTGAVAGLWDDPLAKYAIVPLSALAAVFSAVHVFMDMGARAQRHWDYSARYGEIAGAVDFQLSRDVDFRRPADEFMVETLTRISNLDGAAPALPGAGCCGCKPPVDAPLPTPDEDDIARQKYHMRRRHEAYLSSNEPVVESIV